MSKIMGIINVTPNSYFETGEYLDPQKAISHGLKLFEEGADILDIGGFSTNPFLFQETSQEEEIRRISPVIEALSKKINIPLSIDTFRPEVAERALDLGASFINDITGFEDPLMRKLAAEKGVPICIMHMQDNPKTMQKNPTYPKGIIVEILDFFEKRIALALEDGIQKENIFLDPGIGFGKSLDDNFIILQNLNKFSELGCPLLLGVSRKSFLYKTLGLQPEDVLPATLAISSVICSEVELFRVHDVAPHRQMLAVLEKFNGLNNSIRNGNELHLHTDH